MKIAKSVWILVLGAICAMGWVSETSYAQVNPALAFSPTLRGPGGSGAGPGGDPDSQEFFGLGAEVVMFFNQITQKKLDQFQPNIRIDELNNLVTKEWSVIPVSGLDRVARSIRGTDATFPTTGLDSERWAQAKRQANYSKLAALRFAAHELFVLLGWEGEGSYVYSSASAFDNLLSLSLDYRLSKFCQGGYTYGPDRKSVICAQPHAPGKETNKLLRVTYNDYVLSADTAANSLCQFYGLGQALGGVGEVVEDVGSCYVSTLQGALSYLYCPEMKVAVTDMGRIPYFQRAALLASVTCRISKGD